LTTFFLPLNEIATGFIDARIRMTATITLPA
jgi:hypothetical protein